MSKPTLGNPQNTIEILQKYHFNFQKKFGQNFLIDSHVLDKIVSAAGITKDDFVLEIGPGIGTMTQYLAHAARGVAAVEIDRSLIPILQDTLQEILDNPTYSNAYKEAAKKKCDYLMSVRDSGPSALTRASNSMTIYVPHTRQPNGVSCGPSTVRQTLAHYGLVKNLSTIMSEMSDASKPATYCYSPTNGIFEISKMFY